MKRFKYLFFILTLIHQSDDVFSAPANQTGTDFNSSETDSVSVSLVKESIEEVLMDLPGCNSRYDLRACLGAQYIICDHSGDCDYNGIPYIRCNELYYHSSRLPAGIAYGNDKIPQSAKDCRYDYLKLDPVQMEHNRQRWGFHYHIRPSSPMTPLRLIRSFPLFTNKELRCRDQPEPEFEPMIDEVLLSYLAAHPGKVQELFSDSQYECWNFNSGVYIDGHSDITMLIEELNKIEDQKKILILVESAEGRIRVPKPLVFSQPLDVTIVSVTSEAIDSAPENETPGTYTDATQDAATGSCAGSGQCSELKLVIPGIMASEVPVIRKLSEQQQPATLEATGTELANRSMIECIQGKCNLYGLILTMNSNTQQAPPVSLLYGQKSKGYVYNCFFEPLYDTLSAKGDGNSLIYANNQFSGDVRRVSKLECAKRSCHGLPHCRAEEPGCLALSTKHSLTCRPLTH